MHLSKQNNLNDLIENSYKNNFGIDLKRIHRSKKPQYGNEKKLIKKINDNNRIIFEDGISKNLN